MRCSIQPRRWSKLRPETGVIPAQPGAPDAAADAVVEAGGGRDDGHVAWVAHGRSIGGCVARRDGRALAEVCDIGVVVAVQGGP
jgi:hypothetical protein